MDNNSDKSSSNKNNTSLLQLTRKILAFSALGLLTFCAFFGILIVLGAINIYKDEGLVKALESAGLIGLFCAVGVSNVTKFLDKRFFIRIMALIGLVFGLISVSISLFVTWGGLDYLKKDCPDISSLYSSSFSYGYDYHGTYNSRSSFDYEKYYTCIQKYNEAVLNAEKAINLTSVVAIFFTVSAVYLGFEAMSIVTRVLSAITVFTGAIASILEISLVTFNADVDSKACSVFIILAVYGLIVTPVMHKMSKPTREEEKEALRAEVELELRPRLEKEARELATNEVAAKTRVKNAPSPIHSTPVAEQDTAQADSSAEATSSFSQEGSSTPTIQTRTPLEQPSGVSSDASASDGNSGDSGQDTELPTPA